jgi:hypothetical protein
LCCSVDNRDAVLFGVLPVALDLSFRAELGRGGARWGVAQEADSVVTRKI